MSKEIHVYSDLNLHKNLVKNVLLESFDDTNKPHETKSGRVIFNETTKQIEWSDGEGHWIAGGGATGALTPKGTVGVGGDVEDLPDNPNVGDCYFVITDGTYKGRKAMKGDFFFARAKGSTEQFTICKAETNGENIWLKKDSYQTDDEKHPYVDNAQSLDLYNEDGTPYSKGEGKYFDVRDEEGKPYVVFVDEGAGKTERVTMTGEEKQVGDVKLSKFEGEIEDKEGQLKEHSICLEKDKFELDGDGRPFVKNEGDKKLFKEDGTEYTDQDFDENGYFEWQEEQESMGEKRWFVVLKSNGTMNIVYPTYKGDVGNIAWALVPAGNGYYTYEIIGNGDDGRQEFEVPNIMGTTKCTVTVTAHANNKSGYEIDEGANVLVDTIVTESNIKLNFGHPLYNPGEVGQDEDKDTTTFLVKVAYC